MPIAVTVTKKGRGGRLFRVTGNLVLSGTYPTLGDPLDLSVYFPFGSAKQPDKVNVDGKAGFIYQYDPTNKKLLAFTNTAGGANAPLGEHTNATYVAGILADVITFSAEWLA